jgi:hypothetical protein
LSKKTKSIEDTSTTITSSKKVKPNTNDKSVDTTTIPSSKKVKLNTNDESEVVKSPKKKKVDTKAGLVKTSNNEDNNNFVSATKFIGSKKGYVFTKGKLGLGYYKDIPPVVDKVWRANLSNHGGGSGGNNNRKSMGGGQKRKKGGNNSRRSY